MTTEKKLRISVEPGVELDGRYASVGESSVGQALILHPHPLYGGSMNNNVVNAMCIAARGAGWNTLRFNFRGVGGSTGTHGHGESEQRDVLAAAELLLKEKPGRLAILGYSFGSLVAAKTMQALELACGAVWVAPPWVLEALPPWSFTSKELLIIAGDRDEFGNTEELKNYVSTQGALVYLQLLKGVDHFFVGSESALISLVKDFLESLAN